MGTPAQEVRPAGRRINPVLLVLVGVVALAALVFLVIIPLFGGDDTRPTTPAARRPSPSTTASPTPTPAPPAETFEQFGAKDPFRPLVTEGAPPAPGPGGTPAPAAPGPGAAGAPAPAGGQRVQLIDVFDDAGTTKAQVRVGSTVYTVAPGQVFANNFKLVSVSGNCATLLHGDDKFTLCEGEEVIK